MNDSSLEAEALVAIKDWANRAKERPASSPPDLAPLCKTLPEGRHRSILHAKETLYDGRTVVAFDVKGPGSETYTRHVLPVHFGIMRLLELVPGIKILIKDDAHKNRPKKDGRLPKRDQLLFHLTIMIPKALAKKLGFPRMIGLDRILFNASPDAKLYERRTGDYRYILPSGSIPLRHQGNPLFSQDSLLHAVGELITAAPEFSPATSDSAAHLLSKLFIIGDEWH